MDISIPPPPLTIAGVLAMAAIANGAKVPSRMAQLAGARTQGFRNAVITSNAKVSKTANMLVLNVRRVQAFRLVKALMSRYSVLPKNAATMDWRDISSRSSSRNTS